MDVLNLVLPFRSLFYAPVYLAITRGVMARHGIGVELRYPPAGGDPLDLLRASGADAAVGGPIRLLRLGADATDIRMFGQVTGTTAFVVLARDLPPGDWRALPGRRYLPFTGSRTPLLFTRAHLHRLGIDPDSVTWLAAANAAEAMARFRAGDADLIELPEPDAARLIEEGMREFAAMAQVLGPMPFSVVMAPQPADVAAAKRLARLLAAIGESQAWMHGAGPVAVTAALAATFPEVADRHLLAAATRYLGDGAWARGPAVSAADMARLFAAMAGGGEALPDADPATVLGALQK
ncbi:MAG: ABC transporter substrate-binding protein [Alphaproteobacteria bacterium]|nr:ABC transporter substrate-binding protein [Alphaproteobacteria bacterium]